jgi:hypothetical protein
MITTGEIYIYIYRDGYIALFKNENPDLLKQTTYGLGHSTLSLLILLLVYYILLDEDMV